MQMPSQLSAHPTQQFFLQASSQAHFCTPAQPADQQPNFSSLSSSQWNRTHTMPDNFGAPKSTIGPQFCSPLPVAFYIKDQLGSWSGEDATVLDPNGKLAFTVDARVLSLRRCRVLKDAAGLSVCAMQEKMVSLNKKWVICRGDTVSKNSVAATVTSEYGEVQVNLCGSNGVQYTLRKCGVEGRREFDIMHKRQPIGQARRVRAGETLFLETESYHVTIKPGFDHALILCVSSIMDEYYHQEHDSWGA